MEDKTFRIGEWEAGERIKNVKYVRKGRGKVLAGQGLSNIVIMPNVG